MWMRTMARASTDIATGMKALGCRRTNPIERELAVMGTSSRRGYAGECAAGRDFRGAKSQMRSWKLMTTKNSADPQTGLVAAYAASQRILQQRQEFLPVRHAPSGHCVVALTGGVSLAGFRMRGVISGGDISEALRTNVVLIEQRSDEALLPGGGQRGVDARQQGSPDRRRRAGATVRRNLSLEDQPIERWASHCGDIRYDSSGGGWSIDRRNIARLPRWLGEDRANATSRCPGSFGGPPSRRLPPDDFLTG